MADNSNKIINFSKLRSVLGPNMVAPFLWDRENNRKGIDDQIINCAVAGTIGFRITEESLSQIPQLLMNTVNILKHNIGCDNAMLYMVHKARNEIELVQNPAEGLPSKSLPIRLKQSVAGHVASAMDVVISNDLKNDKRFRYENGFDGMDDIRSAVCVPIILRNIECYAVIELNRSTNKEPFVNRDLETLRVVSGWMGSTIEQHQKRLKIKRSDEIDCKVSNILQSFISLQANFEQSLHKVLEVAKQTIGAAHASFYLFENPVVPCAEHMFTYDPALQDSDNMIVLKKHRSKVDGLVKLAVESKHCININDFATDERVVQKLDSKQLWQLRSLLFIPITDPSGCPLGVVQMINKIVDNGAFSCQDEIRVQSFLSCLVNMLKFQLQLDLRSRSVSHNALCEDVLLHRIPMHIVLTPTAPPTVGDDISWPDNFSSFEWYPTEQDNKHQMIDLCYKMLKTVCNVQLFEPKTMYIFLITIKEMHRPHPFHNFEKSFSSMHGVFCILSRIGDKFDDVEYYQRLSMMIGSLCVGLDHIGLSNAFLSLSKNALSKIYSESYNQNHIVWMARFIIANTRVLHLLSEAQKQMFSEHFQEQILYTDVHAFTLRRSLVEDWFRERAMDWSCGEDRRMVRNLVTMCTYLPMLYKPFRLSKRLIGNYIQQMWSEGDKLPQYGISPIPHYNRAINLTPQINLNILRKIGVSCFQAIQAFLPETVDMYTNCTHVIAAWEQMLENHGKRTWIPEKSISG